MSIDFDIDEHSLFSWEVKFFLHVNVNGTEETFATFIQEERKVYWHCRGKAVNKQFQQADEADTLTMIWEVKALLLCLENIHNLFW